MSAVEPPKQTHKRLAKLGDTPKRFDRRGKGKAPVQEAPVQPTLRSPTPKETTPAPESRKHNCCDNPNPMLDDEGQLVCTNCFTQISEQNIVAEVTFSEDARGAATVQGGFIGENARHASTMGQGSGHVPGGTQKSGEQIAAAKGNRQLDWLGSRFGLNDVRKKMALSLYQIAARHNFSAGRRTDEVIGACLYAVCRQDQNNTVMLMDIAEPLHLNVFRLGEVYKDLCRDLFLDDERTRNATGTQQVLDIESIVMKFCRKLEFGEATKKVSEDAVRIIQRMKRDWMVSGRSPAGLCGAAIILAARMNNFRRSIREVVWVVKVTDLTVLKRVMEFRRSRATALTVDDFRKFGPRLKAANDPPVLYESKVQKMRFEEKKRKRQEAGEIRDGAEVPEEGAGGSSSENSPGADTSIDPRDESGDQRKRQRTTDNQSATQAQNQQEPRRDAEGFLIPALPTDLTQPNGEQSDRPKRGRKKKEALPPLVITEEELITEEALQQEIVYHIEQSEMQESATQVECDRAAEYAAKIAPQKKQDDADRIKLRRQAENITWVPEPPRNEEVTAVDLEKEFEDDPEVQRCLLSEEEQNAKERIWVFNNEDWLRQQQEKKMMEAVTKAAGRNEKGKKATKVTKRKKRKGKIGDGSLLKNTDTPIETPADATEVMLRENTPEMSGFINKAALNALFRRRPSSTSGSSAAPNAETPTDRPTPAEPDADGAPNSESSTSSPPAPTTQQVPQVSSSQESPEHGRAAPQPVTPPETQNQTAGGAEVEESSGDEDDYLPEPGLDYGSDQEFQYGDDDDEYERTLSPTNRWAVDDDAYGNDDYDD